MLNPYTERIVKRIKKQTDKGVKKYGANLQENPLHLSIKQVLEYAAEEAADLTVYIEKAIEMLGEDHTSKYPVRGLLIGFKEGSIPLDEVECRINGYMCAVGIKAKGEAKLEILNKAFKEAYRGEKALSSVVNSNGVEIPRGV